MKKLRFILPMVFFFGFALAFASCSGNSEASSETESTETQMEAQHGDGKEYTSAYVCPMHCKDSGSEEPGKCPVCNMDYIAQAEHTKDGHTH